VCVCLAFWMFYFPANSEHLIFTFYNKGARRENDAEWSDVCVEISRMRPIQGQKLKLFEVLI